MITSSVNGSGTVPAQEVPAVPEPAIPLPLDKYNISVSEVPVRELLFALARDSNLDVDIHPDVSGTVTLHVVDRTLPVILERIGRQSGLRYEFTADRLVVHNDEPYFQSYRADYVNMSRSTRSENRMSTQISTTGDLAGTGTTAGGGGRGSLNTATTDLESHSYNRFWQTLVTSIAAMIGDEISASGIREGDVPVTENVIASPEAGIVNVRASKREHEQVQSYIDQMVESAHRQVLIQATIVEVVLSEDYQAGINWQALDIAGSGIDIVTTTLSPTPTGLDRFMRVTYSGNDFSGLIRLLEEFGSTDVLSSPQAMVLNNQTAILKVVENFVYFELRADTTATQSAALTTINSETRTVPVGIVMSVTPQVSDSNVIILNIRPTISRIADFVEDPSVNLFRAQMDNGQEIPVANRVPQIEVRELESMLRLNDGQTAILGGLMQNENIEVTDAVPGLSRIPVFGRAFRTHTKRQRKSELVIFIRPIIIGESRATVGFGDHSLLLPGSSH